MKKLKKTKKEIVRHKHDSFSATIAAVTVFRSEHPAAELKDCKTERTNEQINSLQCWCQFSFCTISWNVAVQHHKIRKCRTFNKFYTEEAKNILYSKIKSTSTSLTRNLHVRHTYSQCMWVCVCVGARESDSFACTSTYTILILAHSYPILHYFTFWLSNKCLMSLRP